MDRRQFLGSAATVTALAWAAPSRAADKHTLPALKSGVDWLLKQQTQDGGWHSDTYGALRQGSALTALAIYSLCHLPQAIRDKRVQDALARGYQFLLPGIKKQGFVAAPDGSLDYPTYGTAMLATAAYRVDFGVTDEQREKFVDWVASGQLTETREFTEKSPHYGGWDLMGASQVKGLTSDTNVSCSCFAIEAISYEMFVKGINNPERLKVLDRARRWAERCQDLRGDGGFWFSPDPSSINHKAGWHDEQQTKPKTYASATADGLNCLQSTWRLDRKTGSQDQHVLAAMKYLKERPEIKTVPGFKDPDDLNGWGMGLRFYYYQSLAKATGIMHANRLLQHLVTLQQKDGRWQNESSRMREDDPLIATSLAIVAMAVLEEKFE